MPVMTEPEAPEVTQAPVTVPAAAPSITIPMGQCNRAVFLSAVEAAARVAAKQTSLPILTHVLLTPTKGGIRLLASNSEQYAEITTEGHIQAATALPATELLSRIRALPGDSFEFQHQEHGVRLVSGSARFSLQALPASDMPSCPRVTADWSFRVPCDVMARLLKQSTYAVTSDQTRVQYTGILLESEGNSLIAVGTDGVVRVSVSSAEIAGLPKQEIAVIIPADATAELVRLLQAGGELEISAGHNLASFSTGGKTLTTRLIEGQFAPWRRVFPTESTTTAEFSTAEMVQALGRMILAAKDDQFRVQFDVQDNQIRLSAESASSSAEDAVGAVTTGDPVSIALQGEFIREAMARSGSERIRMGLTTPLSPALITPIGETEGQYKAVQSPMHTR